MYNDPKFSIQPKFATIHMSGTFNTWLNQLKLYNKITLIWHASFNNFEETNTNKNKTKNNTKWNVLY